MCVTIGWGLKKSIQGNVRLPVLFFAYGATNMVIEPLPALNDGLTGNDQRA